MLCRRLYEKFKKAIEINNNFIIYAIDTKGVTKDYRPMDTFTDSEYEKVFYIESIDSDKLNREDKITKIGADDYSNNPFEIVLIDKAYSESSGYVILRTKNTKALTYK